MTINAGSLRLVPGALLSGHGGTLTIVTTGPISVEASGTTQARVDVSGGAAGECDGERSPEGLLG